MRKEEFAEVLGEISEKHIAEARAEHKAKKSHWMKWGAMAACFAVVAILGAGMLQRGLLGKKTDTAVLDNGDKIVFVKSDAAGSRVDIDGTITTRQLTGEETAALFPNLPAAAHAVFMADGTETGDAQKLIGFEGTIGNIKMVVSTSEVQLLDTVIDGTEQTSAVNDVSIAAGYFVSGSSGKGEQRIIYYATFEIGNCKVYLENAGIKAESETVKAQLTEVIQQLTENGELDLSSVIDNEAGDGPDGSPDGYDSLLNNQTFDGEASEQDSLAK